MLQEEIHPKYRIDRMDGVRGVRGLFLPRAGLAGYNQFIFGILTLGSSASNSSYAAYCHSFKKSNTLNFN